ncbi:MAG: hypothetical protein FKY71_17995 [Spiribacter salinus]|uniref:Uncharacterized protein n=1 Tax=Spiribacter salinus TaxID=1335746 RepID=A0A540VAL2_9GAMM|nr:MAG: hypothetical protein FKY71_17995 [Spiribacter salinus]
MTKRKGPPQRAYVLDDGTTATVADLRHQLGISRCSAKARLKRSSDPAYVWAPVQTAQRHALDDGSAVTVAEVARAAGISKSSATERLRRSRDPAYVFGSPQDRPVQAEPPMLSVWGLPITDFRLEIRA